MNFSIECIIYYFSIGLNKHGIEFKRKKLPTSFFFQKKILLWVVILALMTIYQTEIYIMHSYVFLSLFGLYT
jgi:hypothetical protein